MSDLEAVSERRRSWIWMGGSLVGADPTVRAPREQEELIPADRERALVEALQVTLRELERRHRYTAQPADCPACAAIEQAHKALAALPPQEPQR